ncbi:MAG: hypothetical protein R3F30_09655 [Planctomycetota bacterium]
MRPLTCLALLPTLAAASCLGGGDRDPGPLRVHHYLAEPQDLEPVRRVMCLPFLGAQAPDDIREHVRTSFLREIAEAGRLQILPLPRLSDQEVAIFESEESGRLDAKELVELARRFHLDGILIGRITLFGDVAPPTIGLRAALVSVHSGTVVWAVDQIFNAGKEQCRQDLLHYYDEVLVEEASRHGPELLMLSPRMFCDYAVARVVQTLR